MAALLRKQAPFPDAARCQALPSGCYGGHAADITAGAPGFGHTRQLLKKFAHIAGIPTFTGQGGQVVGVAGRVHARRAAQGVHFQAGIIGHAQQPTVPGHGGGFDVGVFFKGQARFSDVADFGKSVQSQHFHPGVGQGFRQFTDLARILGGQNDAQHGSHEKAPCR